MDEFGGVLIDSDEFGGILVEDQVLPNVDEFGGTLVEDELPTEPQVEQTVSPDLKERIDNTPWYESMVYELEKKKHEIAFGLMEGVGDLYRS